MNSNWGLVDPLRDAPRDKQRKRERLAERAHQGFLAWLSAERIAPLPRAAAS